FERFEYEMIRSHVFSCGKCLEPQSNWKFEINCPPSSGMTQPVIRSGPAMMLMIAIATSSGSQTLRRITLSSLLCFALLSTSSPHPAFSQRVVMKPGATALTRTFGAKTRASVTVMLLSAAFDAQYGMELPTPASPEMLETLTISPSPEAINASLAARAH